MAIHEESRKPDWIRIRPPSGDNWKEVRAIVSRRGLLTVCDEARCPNKAECWGSGTATFMILGDLCTRGCRFCAVATARRGRPLRSEESEELAAAVEELKLRYVVLTSVDRDDLADRGAGHFAACIAAIKVRLPAVKVEALIPDYIEGEIDKVLAASPDTVAHNLETVRRLEGIRDSRASTEKSLHTLRLAKEGGVPLTKSSLILGLGERRDEILYAMDELRAVGVDVLVLGQYLRPGVKQVPVVEYIHSDVFKEYAELGKEKGFTSVVSGPFARTSYHALEVWASPGQRP